MVSTPEGGSECDLRRSNIYLCEGFGGSGGQWPPPATAQLHDNYCERHGRKMPVVA